MRSSSEPSASAEQHIHTKKGFTLIELIVVIAIIGVLAAILVPAMLGYVKKSKITSANSSAKSIFTAAQSALTDMDTEDVYTDLYTFTGWNSTSAVSAPANKGTTTLSAFQFKVWTYFNDITELDAFSISVASGTCDAVAVVNGNYPGTTPKQFSVDDYDKSTVYSTALTYLISYAKS